MREHMELLRGLILRYIVNYVERSGSSGVVLGLSGGLDSALSAYLAQEALGKDKVLALVLPYKTSSQESLDDAELVASSLGIEQKNIDLTAQIDLYFSSYPSADKLRIGNKIARERMSILYDYSLKENKLVMGTGNKSEWLLGYFTIWGDTGVAFEPLADLYKTTIKSLAKHLGVPKRIIEKEPTADLWPGQTDQGEIGYSYEEIDKVLYLYWEKNYTEADLIKKGYPKPLVERITTIVKRSSFKRKLPDTLKLQDYLGTLF